MASTKTIQVVVHAIAISSGTARTFELRAVDHGALPPFHAGAHIDVHVGPGLVRQYSLCNDPAESHRYLICVKHEPLGRGGSRGMHERVAVGDHLTISAPRSAFRLDPAATTHVLIGGGIGVTPLTSMAHALHRAGGAFELHHYTSSARESPLIEDLRAAPFAAHVRTHHSASGDSLRDAVPASLHRPDPGTAIYVCGPDGLMAHVLQRAEELGWAPERVHTERFVPLVAPGPRADDGSFTVRIASTDQCFDVPADRTIAEVLTANDVTVELSCEQGICGACLTPVLAGEPEHRDEVQSPEEHAGNTQMTICCSRSRTAELTLGI